MAMEWPLNDYEWQVTPFNVHGITMNGYWTPINGHEMNGNSSASLAIKLLSTDNPHARIETRNRLVHLCNMRDPRIERCAETSREGPLLFFLQMQKYGNDRSTFVTIAVTQTF